MNPTTSQQAAQSIIDFTNTRKNANDYLSDAYTKFGVTPAQDRVSQLRGSVMNTQNLLDAVPTSVSGRTSGALVSDAQRGRLVAMEQAPLAQQLTTQDRAYGNASADYKDLLGQATTFSGNAYGADTDKLGAMKTVYDALKQQEDAAAARAAEEAQQRQWQKQFEESQRQFNATLEQSRAAAASQLAGLKYMYNPGGAGGGAANLPKLPSLADILGGGGGGNSGGGSSYKKPSVWQDNVDFLKRKVGHAAYGADASQAARAIGRWGKGLFTGASW